MQITRMVPMLAFQDIEKALGFYRDLLGFELTNSHTEDGRIVWCSVRAGRTEAMFQRHASQARKNGGPVFWLYTDDVEGVRDRLAAAGWQVGEMVTADGRRECETVDTESNPIMICQLLERCSETPAG